MNLKLSEIILTIHKSNEFVSRERVQKELFEHYRVTSLRDLRVNILNLTPLINLTTRQKDVIFYMQVFEQVFNLCTLYDAGDLLARLLKVDTYEDAHLGPLDKNPDVQRVFKYSPSDADQPIPKLKTGEVIERFMAFQQGHRGRAKISFEDFLDYLVDATGLNKREELGIFCRSFPFLVQVILRALLLERCSTIVCSFDR